MFLKNSSQENNPESQLTVASFALSKPVKLGLFEDILDDEINLRVKVTGRSMEPFLRGGEILTIKKVPYASLQKGDLIFFKNRHGLPVLHRIIKKSTNSIQTKGDALMAFDEPVCENDVLGKVCMVEKIKPRGEIKSINMESFFWRNFNCFIALFNSFKTKTYFSARRIYRFQKEKKYSLNIFRN
jgi:signal peptidase I